MSESEIGFGFDDVPAEGVCSQCELPITSPTMMIAWIRCGGPTDIEYPGYRVCEYCQAKNREESEGRE